MSEKRFRNMREVDEYLEKQIQNEKRFFLSVNEDATATFDIIDIVADKTYNFVNDVVSINQAKQLVDLLNELTTKCSQLKKENERLKNKLNVTALELVNEAISMGKAVEISEMSYREFIDYRAENGKPMELRI